jgi:citrate lyase subunit beta/citryl-CoA lyase
VPGVSEKMIAKACMSDADHVFLDLEDAVAPSAKAGARTTIVEALNGLDWGKKTRCVRVNDVTTPWCFEDVIEVVDRRRQEPRHHHADQGDARRRRAVRRPAAEPARGQAEAERRIGIEVLIEEAAGLQNVEEIAAPRRGWRR